MIYVDSLCNHGWKYGHSCHLFADTPEELHDFAKKIGLKKDWAQKSRSGILHYDLTANKRVLAVKNNAKELTRIEFKNLYLKQINSI
jgi:hypothetical protein